jgi:hypothetical protein
MEIYVHRPGDEHLGLRVVEPATTVREAVKLADGETVWMEDSDVAIDVERTLGDAGIGERSHVHVNRCHKVEVGVTFNGAEKDHKFAPATTIGRVFEWATGKHGFNLSKEDRVEHTLQLCGTTIRPRRTEHVGSYVTPEKCEVCFELVPKHRFEG